MFSHALTLCREFELWDHGGASVLVRSSNMRHLHTFLYGRIVPQSRFTALLWSDQEDRQSGLRLCLALFSLCGLLPEERQLGRKQVVVLSV